MVDTGTFARRAGRVLLDLFYPPRCVACGRFGAGFFCGPCVATSSRAGGPGTCANCWAPWDGESFCPGCSHWDALDGGRALFAYEGGPQRAVQALKYGSVRAAAPPMARLLNEVAEPLAVDVAFAVPLHRARRRRRGYNQAEELLRHSGLRSPASGALERVVKTRSQVGLGLSERRANVRGAFRYRGPELTGLTAVLVDDVVTTGATANECARVLKDYGAKKVYVVGFARANPRSAEKGDA